MLTVHHLNQSRSQRVLWALEELQLPYQIVCYPRQKNMLAPPELKNIHPLGKSPVVEDNGYVLAESGAILEYLQETYDSTQQLRPQAMADRLQYRFWLHYAEGSLMPLLVMKLIFGQMGKAPVPWLLRPVGAAFGKGVQKAFLDKQLKPHMQMIEQHLAANPWFAGQRFSIADIQMSFPLLALARRAGLEQMPASQKWLQTVQQRAAWQRAIDQGGELSLPG